MNIVEFITVLNENEIDFFTGVPDSLLQPLTDHLIEIYGCDSNKHMVGHNEGGCVGLAAGYHLATGKTPCIYLQNSGLGNITNPATSLMHPKVYGIPALYLVGWRGEPNKKDEPQHVYQGEVSKAQMETLGIHTVVFDNNTTGEDLKSTFQTFSNLFQEGKSAGLLIKKGALSANRTVDYKNHFKINRERAVSFIAKAAEGNVIISTTGKISRELYEYREDQNQDHETDFLTVGSMGHSSMIALGIAMHKPEHQIWCVDGDGAVLMHLGALSLIGSIKPANFTHIILNNKAHESVGGAPTCASNACLSDLAKVAGYDHVYHIEDEEKILTTLEEIKNKAGCCFVEICVALGSRENLGRPTTTPLENKNVFMEYLKGD